MASYWKHKATHSRDITYSFQCEHCMKDSGPLTATIIGTEAEYNSNYKTLSEQKNQKLQDDAHNFLVYDMYNCFRDATERNIYSKAFNDTCTHCLQPQSWAVAGLKDSLFSTPVVMAIAGVIAGVGAYLYGHFKEGDGNLKVSLIMGGAFIVIALGSLVFNYIKLGTKVKKTASSLVNNVPTIDWSNGQDLIEECKAKIAKKKSKKQIKSLAK